MVTFTPRANVKKPEICWLGQGFLKKRFAALGQFLILWLGWDGGLGWAHFLHELAIGLSAAVVRVLCVDANHIQPNPAQPNTTQPNPTRPHPTSPNPLGCLDPNAKQLEHHSIDPTFLTGRPTNKKRAGSRGE